MEPQVWTDYALDKTMHIDFGMVILLAETKISMTVVIINFVP